MPAGGESPAPSPGAAGSLFELDAPQPHARLAPRPVAQLSKRRHAKNRIQAEVFEAHGGPTNLEELILLFIDWADNK